MSKILQFKKVYKGLQPSVRKAPDASRYWCLLCEPTTDIFKLYEDGTIHCAHCGSRIRNLRIMGVS